MFSFLKNHPFAVEAFFKSSLVLTFAVTKEQLQPLIPPCLALDTFNDKWSFIAIAMVQTKELRPKGFPKFLGNDFFLIGYRVFVRYNNKDGRRLRGLYILKSETDSKRMGVLGNVFTHYNYTTTDITQTNCGNETEIKSNQSDFKVVVSHEDEVLLPDQSPFADWKEARKFTGPLPFTFTYRSETNHVLIIEGVRQNWKPKPIKVESYHFSWLNTLNLKDARLANAFAIKDISYHWKKGETESWSR